MKYLADRKNHKGSKMGDQVHVSSDDNGRVEVKIRGRFDFGLHSEFHEVLDAVKNTADPRVIVDLAATDYIDSSALGMLLLLKEAIGGDASKINIVKCHPDVREIMEMANFHKMFNIS